MNPKKSQLSEWHKDIRDMEKANNALAENSKGTKYNNKLDENYREFDTRDLARDNMTIGELDELHKKTGHSFEVSGDALARFKTGEPGKFHEE
jgi:hypothetical protein